MNKNKRIACIFSDNTYLYYTKGKKDNWKVMYHPQKGYDRNVYDYELMALVKKMADKTSPKLVYQTFVTSVYNQVSVNARQNKGKPVPRTGDLARIDQAAKIFCPQLNPLTVSKIFCMLYCGMISEFRYKNTKLFHRPKRLGVYQVLFENSSPMQAAKFAYGKPYQELDKIMRERGF